MEHIKDWATPLAEVIKALFWPLVVTGFLVGFRKQMGFLLERVKSVGTSGAEFNPSQKEAIENQKRQGSESAISATEIKISGAEAKISGAEINLEFEKEKAALTASQLITEIGGAISKQIESSTYSKEQVTEIGVLTLAKMMVVADFWRIYNFIFGSQLQLLQQLNTTPLKELDLVFHIVSLREKFPEAHKDRTGQAYIHFLTANSLVAEEKDRAEKVTYTLSQKGKEFLHWCIENKLSFNKPF